MKKHLLLLALLLVATPYWLPEQHIIPVQGATKADWNPDSFWYYPWGRSGTHKGIDIFAKHGQPVVAASSGLVVAQHYDEMGGNIVLILGAKWRFHYYAHLQDSSVQRGQWLSAGEPIGHVGDSGNAKGKPPHLHYSIRSLFPLPWQADLTQPQGLRKMFYLDPHEFLSGACDEKEQLDGIEKSAFAVNQRAEGSLL